MRTAQQHHHLLVHCPLSFVKSFIPFMFQIFELNHIASNIFKVMELLVMILGPRRAIGHIKEGVNNSLIILISPSVRETHSSGIQTPLRTILLA